MNADDTRVEAAQLSNLWSLVHFLHPGGETPQWADAFNKLVQDAVDRCRMPDPQHVAEALRSLDDPLTGVVGLAGPGTAPSLTVEPPTMSGATVIRARDFRERAYDHGLQSELRRLISTDPRSGVLLDLRGADWWFLRQAGPFLANALGQRLRLPAECGRVTSGPVLGRFDQSGGPWEGVVSCPGEIYLPAPGSVPAGPVTLIVSGHGAFTGQIAMAAQFAGAVVVRVDEQSVPYGNSVATALARSSVARVRTSWLEGSGSAPDISPDRDAIRQSVQIMPDSAERGGLCAAAVKLAGYLRYFYPYRDERLIRSLDRAAAVVAEAIAQGRQVTEDEVASILIALDDSHARIYSPRMQSLLGEGLEQSPFSLATDGLVSVQFALGEGGAVPAGATLLSIDGVPVTDRVDAIVRNLSHSSDRAAAWAVERHLLGTADVVELAFVDAGVGGSYRLHREEATAPAPPVIAALSPEAVYIDMTQLEQRHVAEALEAIASAHTLLLDLRGYAGAGSWEFARRICSRDAKIAVFERRELRGVGPTVTAISRHESAVRGSGRDAPAAVGVLIDHRTISRSEYLAAMIKAATGCSWLGTASAGCVGDVAHFEISRSMSAAFSGQQTLLPDGTAIQGAGLAPDLVIDWSDARAPAGWPHDAERAYAIMIESR